MTSTEIGPDQHDLLPGPAPVRLVDPSGHRAADPAYPMPSPDVLRALYRRMVIGRRFDQQATALTRQGRLAVYPSSHGQEACQVGAVLALGDADWLFPTYRDTVSLITRDIDPVEALTMLRGTWHCGYDPYAHRTAPQCTPLATAAPHAVGLADAARRRGDPVAALSFLGDGATSEGDAHEAFNFAAVYGSPVVFCVQNNGWAISVPLDKQTKAPTLAHKAVGYGMRGFYVDGNDAAAVHAVVSRALADARAGRGPALVECLTYRIEAHTNADDDRRYRDDSAVASWRELDPVARLEQLMLAEGVLDRPGIAAVRAEADAFAARTRDGINAEPALDPADLFTHVYAAPPPRLREQAAALAAELAGSGEGA
jgi:pyruvate dehydrogenase E1 component alpha subunit